MDIGRFRIYPVLHSEDLWWISIGIYLQKWSNNVNEPKINNNPVILVYIYMNNVKCNIGRSPLN